MSAEAAARGRGEGAADDATRYLTFTLNGESYALDIFHITEILGYRNLTVVPMTPDFVRGVINLRGRAVPVIDLAIRFAKGATSIARRTGIRLSPGKETLVMGRLDKRLRKLGLRSYTEYLQVIRSPQHAAETARRLQASSPSGAFPSLSRTDLASSDRAEGA